MRFFRSSSEFRKWLEVNHGSATGLVVGFYKRDSGKESITYPQALDEALCFGWIDGVRRSVDALSYSIRFTPRRAKSNWSRVNIQHAERLIKSGRMAPIGLRVYSERDPEKSGSYSSENRPNSLAPEDERRFQADKTAWDYFRKQAPSYQRTATWWVISAKRSDTRARRLSKLMDDSAHGRRLDLLTPNK